MIPKTEKPKGKKILQKSSKKKKNPKEPTQKQKLLAKKMVENGGKSLSKSMKDVGYSDAYASNPQKLKKTQGWQSIMDKYFSDTKLGKKHAQLLEARSIEHYTFPNSMTDKQIIDTILEGAPGSKVINIQRNQAWARAHFSVPDNITQFKSLELGYKVKSKIKSANEEDPGEQTSQEIREVIFRIRKILPAAGQ